MAHFLATVVSTRHSMFISDTSAWVVAQMQTLAADRDTPAWVVAQMQTLAADPAGPPSRACRSSTPSSSARSSGR